MKRLSDSEIFELINDKYAVKDTLTAFKDENNLLLPSKMDHQLDTIKRKYKYPLATKVLEEIKDGTIVPVLSNDLNLPKIIPCWGKVMSDDKLKIYVNLSPYRGIKLDDKGFLDGDVRIIYSLLQAGCIMKNYYENYKKFHNNIGFLKLCMVAYTKLFIKVLDKTYGIKLNKMKFTIVSYLIAKFFLINVCERENNDATNILAFNVCETTGNENLIKEFDKNFKTEEIYQSLSKFLSFLANSEEMLKHLTMREFYQTWMTMYDFSTILAIELLEHFLIMISHVIVGSNINKVYAIDNVLKNENVRIYNEMSLIIK
jgi:hypothetical protein